MSPEPDNDPRQKSSDFSPPDFFEIARFQNSAAAPNKFLHSVLAEVENGRPSREIVELACFELSNADDFPSILKHAAIVAMLLRTDEVARSPVSEVVDGWAEHAADPDRWQLARILTPLELPFDDSEVIEYGAFNAICQALFLEIENSSYNDQPVTREAVDGSLIVEQVQQILSLGRPYEQDMLEALKRSFWSVVVAPDSSGQEIGEFAAFMMQELGKDVAIYLEDALLDSFGVSLPDTFDPLASGKLGGSVLHYFHESQDLPRYARENILQRLAEQLNSNLDLNGKLRIFTALASYASADSAQIDICLNALERISTTHQALAPTQILGALCSLDLYRTGLAAALVSTPYICNLCRNCSELAGDDREQLARLLDLSGLSITSSNPVATRSYIKNFVRLALVDDQINIARIPLPQILTALAVQDPEDFSNILLELCASADETKRVAPICANIVSVTVSYGLDWLPSEAIERLRAAFRRFQDFTIDEKGAAIVAALAALDELSDYGS